MRESIRRWVRGVQRGGEYVLALPHHALVPEARGLQGADDNVRRAYKLADGTRTVAALAQDAGVAKADVMAMREHGLVVLWRGPVPPAPRPPGNDLRWVVVSPHLDDAALSCGGRMLGDPAGLVLNVFSQSVWWRLPPDEAGPIQAIRRTEEQHVGRMVGCAVEMMDLPEALLRGYSMEQVFERGDAGWSPAAADADQAAADAVAARAEQLARAHPLAHWYLPLGVGGHVDHLVVRDACTAALARAAVPATHVHFFEDLPYAAKREAGADFSRLIEGRHLRRDPLDIEEVLRWKREMLAMYWSQFGPGEIEEVIHFGRGMGEGVWNDDNTPPQ